MTSRSADKLAGLAALLDTVPPGEADDYVPHPLDVLIFAAIDQDGAMQQAELLAALSADVYTSRGQDRPVTAGTLRKRLPELVAAGALVKTAAGYAIGDGSFVDVSDATFH